MKQTLLALIIVSTSFATMASADWTSFRNGGTSTVTQELPRTWSQTEGIAWQRELIGYGQSTPVILGDRVFVTSVEGTMKNNCVIQCLDLAAGNQLWKVSIPAANLAASTYSASRAAPTPVVDDAGVYVFFESGDVLAVDHQGKQVWHRDLTTEYGKFENNHGLGASPAQSKTDLIVNVEHRGPSYLMAIDKKTGQTKWKVDREPSSSWASPIVSAADGKEQIIVSSGGHVAAYEAVNGELLWKLDGIAGNSVPSPTLIGSKLFIGARLPEFTGEGTVKSNCCVDIQDLHSGTPEIIWRADKAISDYASPVICGDFSYFINKAGVLYCLDANTGEVHYASRLGTQCWGTPIVNGDFVYFFGKDGKTQVIEKGPEFEVVASNDLWDTSDPPRPETYVEGQGGSHHGEGDSESKDGESSSRGRSGGRGAGMIAAMMKGDSNADGILGADEVAPENLAMVARLDKNGDGSLDQAELQAMAESFAASRADSQASARDPIVYGAVASGGKILIRTGTRLYCIE